MPLLRFCAVLLGSLTLAICLALPAAASTEENEAAPAVSVQDMAKGLQSRIEALEQLNEEIGSAPERYHRSLITRRDDLAFRTLQELDKLVGTVAALPEDDPQREQGRELLQPYLTFAGERILHRVDSLGDRISAHLQELESLSGADAISMEAQVHAIQDLRFRYYTALVGVIEGFRKLSIPAEDIADQFRPMIRLQVEALVGRLEYNGSVLRELRARQALERDNADLKTAIASLSRTQKKDLGYLSSAIGVLDKQGIPTQEYRAVLVQQGQGLSLSTLESGAIATLLEDSWRSIKDSLVTRAPNFIFNTVVFLLIIMAFYALGRLARKGVRAACDRPGVTMSTLHKNTLVSLSGGLVTLVGLLIALGQIGISLGPMLAGFGVAGFIVGFALQDTLGNFASGGMILIYRPFDVDDYVVVAGIEGLVKKMSLVSTTIATIDNQILVVPNSKIWGDVIKNVTAQKVRRVDMVFGISYGDDIEKAERVLHSVLEDHEKVLREPEWLIKVHQLGDSSVNFVVRPWVKTQDYWNVYWDITREVKLRFDREGVSIPFPQRDVHIYQNDA